jgi:hypothetical protein
MADSGSEAGSYACSDADVVTSKPASIVSLCPAPAHAKPPLPYMKSSTQCDSWIPIKKHEFSTSLVRTYLRQLCDWDFTVALARSGRTVILFAFYAMVLIFLFEFFQAARSFVALGGNLAKESTQSVVSGVVENMLIRCGMRYFFGPPAALSIEPAKVMLGYNLGGNRLMSMLLSLRGILE